MQAQAEALKKLGDMAPNFIYKNGKLVMAYAGKYDGGFWATWLKGSWRMGTIFNDIFPRNIGALGKIFDPALPPINVMARSVLELLGTKFAKIFKYPYDMGS